MALCILAVYFMSFQIFRKGVPEHGFDIDIKRLSRLVRNRSDSDPGVLVRYVLFLHLEAVLGRSARRQQDNRDKDHESFHGETSLLQPGPTVLYGKTGR